MTMVNLTASAIPGPFAISGSDLGKRSDIHPAYIPWTLTNGRFGWRTVAYDVITRIRQTCWSEPVL